jgi:hypothetical protein
MSTTVISAVLWIGAALVLILYMMRRSKRKRR